MQTAKIVRAMINDGMRKAGAGDLRDTLRNVDYRGHGKPAHASNNKVRQMITCEAERAGATAMAVNEALIGVRCVRDAASAISRIAAKSAAPLSLRAMHQPLCCKSVYQEIYGEHLINLALCA
ncbi:MAG: hypothetical protein LBU32_13755 [Clostridiales bacterium]|nr:hypothetical protein [Clostridiales bacterium]